MSHGNLISLHHVKKTSSFAGIATQQRRLLSAGMWGDTDSYCKESSADGFCQG